MQASDIVDGIYEAALVPEKWEGVLAAINGVVGTRGGVIFTQSAVSSSFIATPEAREYFQRFVDGGWDRFNSRRDRANRMNHAGFLTDLDVFEERELVEEPLYRDFLYPIGLGWSVGTHITTADGDTIAASFDGAYRDGPIPRRTIDWLDSLRPHLARSLSMVARLRSREAVRIVDGLGAFGLPACVVDRHGRMLAANTHMQPLIPSTFMDRRQGVTLRVHTSDQLLRKALAQAASMPGTGQVMSLPIPASEGHPASLLHIVPVRGSGQDLLPGGYCILAVSRLASSALPSIALLRGLFDLTPAEARIARLVAGGTAPKDIGAAVGISSNTVKAQLKSIYNKTGTGHYGALIRLLSGAPLPTEGE